MSISLQLKHGFPYFPLSSTKRFIQSVSSILYTVSLCGPVDAGYSLQNFDIFSIMPTLDT
jgi:hypothetical protein